jgi:hypothetical protein
MGVLPTVDDREITSNLVETDIPHMITYCMPRVFSAGFSPLIVTHIRF